LDPLVHLLGATGEVAQYAKSYAVILLAGSITATGFSSLVRAEGRMRYSTMEWIIPVVTQMVLDPVLIIGFGLGVQGAALGTVGGQFVSAGMGVYYFLLQRRRLYGSARATSSPTPGCSGRSPPSGHRHSWPD
jgi:Na+-driven multidrug efflux pump